MKRIIIRVQWAKCLAHWYVKVGAAMDSGYDTQREAVARGRELIDYTLIAGNKAQLVLHGKDGRIRWERTYPRSSDPRRSKG